MPPSAYKMTTKYTRLDFDGEELWNTLEAAYGEPTGMLNQDTPIFTVEADYLKEVLDDLDRELTLRQREILGALYKKAKRQKFQVFDITFG
jgi:tRNA uridine 5-carbamoylmethylation protein Kti12